MHCLVFGSAKIIHTKSKLTPIQFEPETIDENAAFHFLISIFLSEVDRFPSIGEIRNDVVNS